MSGRLGDDRQEDEVFELSVTRLIDEVEFTDDGAEAFIVGREGINRLRLSEIDADTFVPPLPLELSETAFPPRDLEVEVSPAGDFLVARSSEFGGVALYRPPTDGAQAVLRLVELSAIPTDIDLFEEDGGAPGVLATLRGSDELAIVDVEAPTDADPLTFFQHNHGLTLFDMATGYRRPVVLQGEPADLVVTEDAEGTQLVFVMQQSDDPSFRGVTRVDLETYRADFFKLACHPQQLGVVAGKVFVSQSAGEGRITFIDVNTGAQRTVSGYELNAGID